MGADIRLGQRHREERVVGDEECSPKEHQWAAPVQGSMKGCHLYRCIRFLYFSCHLQVQVSVSRHAWYGSPTTIVHEILQGPVRQSSYLLPTLPQDLYGQKSPFNFNVAKISPRQLCNASHMWVVKPSPVPISFSWTQHDNYSSRPSVCASEEKSRWQ